MIIKILLAKSQPIWPVYSLSQAVNTMMGWGLAQRSFLLLFFQCRTGYTKCPVTHWTMAAEELCRKWYHETKSLQTERVSRTISISMTVSNAPLFSLTDVEAGNGNWYGYIYTPKHKRKLQINPSQQSTVQQTLTVHRAEKSWYLVISSEDW